MDIDSFELNVALIKAEVESVISGRQYTEVITALIELIARKSKQKHDIEFLRESFMEVFPEAFHGSGQ